MNLLMSSNGRNKNGISIKGKGYNNNNDACFQNIGGFLPINVNVEINYGDGGFVLLENTFFGYTVDLMERK